ncbi:ABC transporter ATP-binding protein [Corynebacterium sp.]|uniref:ABC transporter ATP-binding protein n=1 Tax=Corynebacterium sp. TaxID=1720 RepID=UPI003B3A4024
MSTQTSTPTNTISASGLTVGYGKGAPIIDDLSLDIPGGKVTTIIGPNGCGKSTLLRSLARLLPSRSGDVRLDATDIGGMKRKDLAKIIGVLPQSPVAPPGLVVSDLVSRGRHPHQSWIRQWSSTDEDEVMAALEMTSVADLADRPVDSLSGGQRQRVWISMVLAQHTEVLFLDEPTTYLDLSHSIEVLDLVRELKGRLDRTVVMVLHDLNLAVRYSDHLVVMRDGAVEAAGSPGDIITPNLLKDVFALDAVVIDDPVVGGPLIVPSAPPETGDHLVPESTTD